MRTGTGSGSGTVSCAHRRLRTPGASQDHLLCLGVHPIGATPWPSLECRTTPRSFTTRRRSCSTKYTGWRSSSPPVARPSFILALAFPRVLVSLISEGRRECGPCERKA